jgi:hypothetical protein
VKAILAMLSDRKRSQRGSVLSGVLIITLFLGVISGALMTALSSDFLLSRNLSNRVNAEATVRSAAELAMDQLQTTPLGAQCPNPPSVSLNGQVAATSYLSCLQRRVTAVPSDASFGVDGTRAARSGADEYLVGDSAGNVFGYPFGSSSGWSVVLGGSVTGPTLGILDGSGAPLDFVPVAGASAEPASGGGCGSFCVSLIAEGTAPSQPQLQCYLSSSGQVIAAAAVGLANPNLVFFGDSGGTLYAYNATGASQCALQTSKSTGFGAVVAGPIVFKNGTRDEIFVVVDGAPSRLLHYTYNSGSFGKVVDNLKLPASGPQGIAVEPAWPARVAITFASGTVAIVQIDSGFDSNLLASTSIGSGFSDAPYWCQCPSGTLIGVGSTNGTLYLLDTNLSSVGSYSSGSPIRTTPAADTSGIWFFGADDGYLREVRNAPIALAAKVGPLGGSIGSAAIVGQCSIGVCIYLGSQNTGTHVVPIDAREAVMTSCISASPPDCSGQNPRLWTQVVVDSASAPEAVHVQGWSYYSP